ncbi:hypothetical protein ACSAZL_07145 [Methanosarcina sp. T3]|uniref:hypothetical protein n=1 Tax=Methanosarcina sp. T3 TaxID=3439062 RepID=UPI003F849B89
MKRVILERKINRIKQTSVISKKGDNMTDANGEHVVNENGEKNGNYSSDREK